MRTDYLLEDEEVALIIEAMEFYSENQSFPPYSWDWVDRMIRKIKQELS